MRLYFGRKAKKGGSSNPCNGLNKKKCQSSSNCNWVLQPLKSGKSRRKGLCVLKSVLSPKRRTPSPKRRTPSPKRHAVNGKPAMPKGPYYDPSQYKSLSGNEKKMREIEMALNRSKWNSENPEPQEGDKLSWDQKTDVAEHFRKELPRITVPIGENKKIYIKHLQKGVDKFIDEYEYDPEWTHQFWDPYEYDDDELLAAQVTAMIDAEMQDGSFAPGGYLSV